MKPILKLIIALLNLIFSLMKLLPVQKKVTFISRQANSKSEDMELLENELKEQDPGVKMVFLCKTLEPGLGKKIGYCFHVLSQMYHIATSKVVVLDSYCIGISVLKQRTSLVVIQMWHALGSLKKFGYSIVGEAEGRDQGLADAMAMHKNYTYVISSSGVCAKHFGEAFGYGKDKVKVFSLPRVDKLTNEQIKEETVHRIYERYPELEGKKVIVYAPTFRKDRDISKEIDDLAREFDSEKYVFVLKKHPLMAVNCSSCNILEDKEFTTLEMIFAADYVICDYSAIVFESAILQKPMFFYIFDYESYGVDRDFYIDYKGEMPGFMSAEPEKIAEAIADERYDLGKVESFSRRYVAEQVDCSKKLAQFILGFVQ